MVTMVGKESALKDLLHNLIELDFDAIKAYEAAAERLENAQYQLQLREFMADHVRHTRELSTLLRQMGQTPPDGPDAKAILTKGKVVLADMMGDVAILKAMKTNEDDTNTAYERAVAHPEATLEVKRLLEQNLQDERRHRQWIESTIETRKRAA